MNDDIKVTVIIKMKPLFRVTKEWENSDIIKIN